jgi:hypothetical protein
MIRPDKPLLSIRKVCVDYVTEHGNARAVLTQGQTNRGCPPGSDRVAHDRNAIGNTRCMHVLFPNHATDRHHLRLMLSVEKSYCRTF